MATRELSSQQLAQLREMGEALVRKFGPRQRSATFKWKGGQYVVRRSYFRTFIETLDGRGITSAYDPVEVDQD